MTPSRPARDALHAGQPVLESGPPIADARVVAIMLHGRAASAEDILGLATRFRRTDVAYLAPQAAGRTWYPRSFMAPVEQNEPWLASALGVVSGLLDRIERQGKPPHAVALIGFSQGACLALEFAARHPRRYRVVAGFSGGLIGAPGSARTCAGDLEGTPVFLGCSDVDPHIPVSRVEDAGRVFRRMGAAVDERIYPGMAHTINADEIDAVGALLDAG